MTAKLILGDALDVLPTLEAGSFDAVVTDPPFGIGFDYSGEKEANCTPSEYWKWLCPRYEEALRCLKPGGFIAVWQTQLYYRYFWEWFGDEIRIYAACKNFVQMRPTPINHAYDPVVMMYKAGAKPLFPLDAPRTLDWSVANTANMKTRKTSKGHPCPRPLDQVKDIVVNFVAVGGKVLDPFAGSGTTLIAALLTGRESLGIEIDPAYHAIAQRRIDEVDAIPPLVQASGLFDAQEDQ